jgi:hypothetical protein
MEQKTQMVESVETESEGLAILFRFSEDLRSEEADFLRICRETGLPKAAAARMLVLEALRARKAA